MQFGIQGSLEQRGFARSRLCIIYLFILNKNKQY
jgi:hypothetical protein